MRARFAAVVLGLAAGLATLQAAQAQSPAAIALDQALPKLDSVCYGRFYDAAHLKAHPKQSVTSVRLLRDFTTIRLERHIEGDREAKDGRVAYADIIVTYRGSGAKRFNGGANCRIYDTGKIYCSSDGCDGGGFELRVTDAETIVLGSKEGGGRFTVSGGCGGGPNRNLNASADDQLFQLKKMPVKSCR